MNNNITEDYVSFEICKLLKEKGFSVYCTSLYTEEGKQNDVGNYNGIDDDNYISYSRPTHALAIKWIRENFQIWFQVGMQRKNYFTLIIYENNPDIRIVYNNKGFASYEETTEAALLYTLQNLIP